MMLLGLFDDNYSYSVNGCVLAAMSTNKRRYNTPTGLGGSHQYLVTLPSRELRLNWVIGPSGPLVHVPRTISLELFRRQRPKTLPVFKKQLKLHLLHNSKY